MISFLASVFSSSDTYRLVDVVLYDGDVLSYPVSNAEGRGKVYLIGAWNAEASLVKTASKPKDTAEEQTFIILVIYLVPISRSRCW